MSQDQVQVAFRVDASLEIGSGHVVRCLTLARALRNAGARCHFICRDLPGNLIFKIVEEGFVAHILPAGIIEPADGNFCYAKWLEVPAQRDAEETGIKLAAIKPKWLIVDHYGIDHNWHDSINGLFEKLMVIDDLANRPLRADLLLNQNFGALPRDYQTFVSESCQFATGPEYCLLRPEFCALRKTSLKQKESGELRRILVTMGGVDLPNAASRVLRSMDECGLPKDVEVTVVLGSACPWIKEIETLSATLTLNSNILVDVTDMAGLMSSVDFAIGAAGGTTWEFCSLGLPFAMLAIADNQIPTVRRLSDAGIALPLVNGVELDQSLADALRKAMTPALLREYGARAAAVTDGMGVYRVLGLMGFSAEVDV